jgi:Pvc16 N-terminal domain
VLALIDESLESFLRATVPLSAVDIDVSFEVPDEEWAAKLTRPTVNLHLWDVRRSTTRAVTGTEEIERNGVAMRRLMLPRIEMRYFVTVWTSEHDDERTLMSAILIAFLANAEMPGVFLSADLSSVPCPQLQIARSGDNDTFKLEERMKFGLHLTVTSAVDTNLGVPLAPEVGELAVTLRDRSTGAADPPMRRIAGEVVDPSLVGTMVRSPLAVVRINERGRFLINARPGDELVIEAEPVLKVIVPPVGGVVVRT